jgi:hypothetical protein
LKNINPVLFFFGKMFVLSKLFVFLQSTLNRQELYGINGRVRFRTHNPLNIHAEPRVAMLSLNRLAEGWIQESHDILKRRLLDALFLTLGNFANFHRCQE